MIKKSWKHRNLGESIIGALRGLKIVFHAERNARAIIIVGSLVLIAASLLGASLRDHAILVIVIISVFACETFNTLVEVILDMIQPQDDPHVKILKDIASGVVLLASIGAVAIGFIIFLPKVWPLISKFL